PGTGKSHGDFVVLFFLPFHIQFSGILIPISPINRHLSDLGAHSTAWYLLVITISSRFRKVWENSHPSWGATINFLKSVPTPAPNLHLREELNSLNCTGLMTNPPIKVWYPVLFDTICSPNISC